jgi:hypothetical protein
MLCPRFCLVVASIVLAVCSAFAEVSQKIYSQKIQPQHKAAASEQRTLISRHGQIIKNDEDLQQTIVILKEPSVVEALMKNGIPAQEIRSRSMQLFKRSTAKRPGLIKYKLKWAPP